MCVVFRSPGGILDRAWAVVPEIDEPASGKEGNLGARPHDGSVAWEGASSTSERP